MSTPQLDQELVVATAAEMVDDAGLDALTLKAVAERVGVTQPALYRHVDSLDHVWRLLGLSARTDLAANMAEACIGLSGADAVRAVCHEWRNFGRSYPGRYRSTERAPVAGDAELEAAVQRVLDVLAMALRGYGMSDEELVHQARLLRSALHGFVSFELGDGHPTSPPIDETFDRLIDLLCLGFDAQPNDLVA